MQECGMQRMQNAECKKCRIARNVGMQSAGVQGLQNAGMQDVRMPECRMQECRNYRMQDEQ